MAAEVLDSDDLFHLLSEVAQGIGPEGSTLPDTALVRETRAKLIPEVAAMQAAGLVVDVPREWPAPATRS